MKPKVSVIITHHLNINDSYLGVCLLGVVESKGIAFEAIIVSDAEVKPKISEYTSRQNISLYWDKNLDTATKKIDFAVKELLSEDSTHLMFLSDDVILSQYCLADMYAAFNSRHMIMTPMSNSDLSSRYEADLEIAGNRHDQSRRIKLKPDMSLEDFTDNEIVNLITFKRGKKILIRTDWVCFYAVMMTKGVWKVVQGYDAELEYRHNDQDFCMRATKLGIPSVVNLGAFAFHFGSRTMKYVGEDTKTRCTNHFINKWRM